MPLHHHLRANSVSLTLPFRCAPFTVRFPLTGCARHCRATSDKTPSTPRDLGVVPLQPRAQQRGHPPVPAGQRVAAGVAADAVLVVDQHVGAALRCSLVAARWHKTSFSTLQARVALGRQSRGVRSPHRSLRRCRVLLNAASGCRVMPAIATNGQYLFFRRVVGAISSALQSNAEQGGAWWAFCVPTVLALPASEQQRAFRFVLRCFRTCLQSYSARAAARSRRCCARHTAAVLGRAARLVAPNPGVCVRPSGFKRR